MEKSLIIFLVLLGILILTVWLGKNVILRGPTPGYAAKEGFIAYEYSSKVADAVSLPLYDDKKKVTKLYDNLFLDTSKVIVIEVDSGMYSEKDKTAANVKQIIAIDRLGNTVILSSSQGELYQIVAYPPIISVTGGYSYDTKGTTTDTYQLFCYCRKEETYMHLIDATQSKNLYSFYLAKAGDTLKQISYSQKGIFPSLPSLDAPAFKISKYDHENVQVASYHAEKQIYQVVTGVYFDLENGNLILYDADKKAVSVKSRSGDILKDVPTAAAVKTMSSVDFTSWTTSFGQFMIVYMAKGTNTLLSLYTTKGSKLQVQGGGVIYFEPKEITIVETHEVIDPYSNTTTTRTTSGTTTTDISSAGDDNIVGDLQWSHLSSSPNSFDISAATGSSSSSSSEYWKWYWYWNTMGSTGTGAVEPTKTDVMNNNYMLKTQVIPPVFPVNVYYMPVEDSKKKSSDDVNKKSTNDDVKKSSSDNVNKKSSNDGDSNKIIKKDKDKTDLSSTSIYNANDLFKTNVNNIDGNNSTTKLTSVLNYGADSLTNLGVDSWGWDFPSTLWNNSRLSGGSGGAMSGNGALRGPGNVGIDENSPPPQQQQQQLPVDDSSSSLSQMANNQRNSYAPAYAETPIDNYSSYGALSSQGQGAQYLPVTADFSAFRK